LIKSLWKSLKVQKEELAFLKAQHEKELDLFCKEQLSDNEDTFGSPINKMIKGLDDRIVISVSIKTSGYLKYDLDAQLDTGAMNSCARFGAIPSYYWQQISLAFRAVNKTEMPIKHICPDFPIYINDRKVPVTLYSFDTGSDILLGQDFVNKCLPMTVHSSSIDFTISNKVVSVPTKNDFVSRVPHDTTQNQKALDVSASSLIKIQKIIKHVEIHGLDAIRNIKTKIENDCTSELPNAFWTREQYFVNLPYKEDYLPKPQKASANSMSPTELEYCKAEIQELLQRKLIEIAEVHGHVLRSM
jgi:hypothetical protein